MLLQFQIRNYLSIKETQTLSMVPDNLKELTEFNIHETGFNDLTLLKSAGIFGPNSSGKSNLVKAFHFLREFTRNSMAHYAADSRIPIKPFLLQEGTRNLPSHFTIEFLANDLIYTYSLAVDRVQVHEEELTYRKKKAEFLVFKRVGQKFETGKRLKNVDQEIKMTRSNASFLSTLAMLNHEFGIEILTWFRKIRFLKEDYRIESLSRTAKLFSNDKYGRIIGNLLKNADLGFERLESKSPENFDLVNESMAQYGIQQSLTELRKYLTFVNEESIHTIHDVYNDKGEKIGFERFDINQESTGTKKFISMIGTIAKVLVDGGVLLIDEIDASLHAFLSESIVRYFHSKTNNPKKAQLIFISHNTFLMRNELMRRDQIYVAQKDHLGATHLSTLFDQKVRHDANFEKSYIENKVKGLPRTNAQLSLFD